MITLRDGDIPDGSPSSQAAHLSYCDGCKRLRAGPYRVVHIHAYPYHFCSKHDDTSRAKLIALVGEEEES